MEPTPPDIVHEAIDALLVVVEKSAQDLLAFHETVTRARRKDLPPLPRATVATTARVINNLRQVDQELRDILIGLGLVGG